MASRRSGADKNDSAAPAPAATAAHPAAHPALTPAAPDRSRKIGRGRAITVAGALHRVRFSLAVLVLFVVLAVVSGLMLRNVLLKNSYESNTALARFYASETDSALKTYEALLDFGSASIEARVFADEPWGNLESWAELYCSRLRSVLGNQNINVYGVVDGRVLAVGDLSLASDFDPTTREWYQTAMQNRGEPVFTDVYEDAATGESVVTVAQACEGVDAVLAFDIYPSSFGFRFASSNLPEGVSCFLCDGSGVDLYHETDLAEDAIPDYLVNLVARIDAGELDGHDAYIIDSLGERRAVDYTRLPNGWYSIVTTPYSLILGDFTRVLAMLALMVAVFLAALVAMAVRDWRRTKAMERTNETVRVLGNSYYAIYLVNYDEGTYEMIKGSDYVRERIPASGPYESLLRTASEVIEESTFEEFEKSFSAQNIRELVAGRVRDYGGDFLRNFGDKYLWVNVRVLYDESLAPEEVVLCFRVVDQEKRRQLQERSYLEQALDASQRSLESKQSFFNNMSHDMRTPLNAILGLTELARRDLPSGDRQKTADYLRRIESSGKQLLELVNDILDISRMENGKVLLTSERMNLLETMSEVVSVFQLQAENQGRVFEYSIDAPDPYVYGDPARLRQVMNNLLSNALKYTRVGDKISVTVRRGDRGKVSTYEIVVADTGIGMSEEYLPHIFELYEREQRFGTSQAVGTGLGMPITKSLVTQMGGSIEVQSKLDVGTRFRVTLPFTPAPKGEPTTCDATPAVAAGLPAGGEAALLDGAHVILAEDNEINMEISTELLSGAGVVVTQAWNGREAVDAFAASAPYSVDAILLDMRMPVMDGCEAARAIRALGRPDAATVPIVAVTANAFAEDVAATTAAGMDAHVSKPIDFNMLCHTLASLIGRGGGRGEGKRDGDKDGVGPAGDAPSDGPSGGRRP